MVVVMVMAVADHWGGGVAVLVESRASVCRFRCRTGVLLPHGEGTDGEEENRRVVKGCREA